MFANVPFRVLTSALAALLWAGMLQAGVTLEGSATHEKVAKPGERYRGAIVLRNAGATPAEAKLYQTDYSFAADGSNDFGPPGRLPRSNAKWVGLSQNLVTVPPGSTVRVDYEIKVPADKGLSGTYWSMIMVEPIAATSRESSADLAEGTTALTQVIRYGVQLVSHLGRGGQAGLSFTNPRLVTEDAKRLFAVDVENTGQQWLRPGLSLELYSQTGNPIGKFQGNAQRLYPGTAARFLVDIGEVPKGKYLGLVVADGTGDNLFGANVELEVE